MQVLRSRLYELELERRRAETAELEANKADIFIRVTDKKLRACPLSAGERHTHKA